MKPSSRLAARVVGNHPPEPPADAFYRDVMTALLQADVPFLIGGAYGLAHHTGIVRDSKDLDLFLRPADMRRAEEGLAHAGYKARIAAPHWLGKVCSGAYFADLIFGSGNGVCVVDDAWFAHAASGELLGVQVRFCPAEETIWSKAYIMERERFDGADVAHLLHACGARLDWHRLLARFGPHWRVLLSHVVLFGFVYPMRRDAIPRWVEEELAARLADDRHSRRADRRVCQGPLLSNAQYLVDRWDWGYRDGRLRPEGPLTAEDVARATATVSPIDQRVHVRRAPGGGRDVRIALKRRSGPPPLRG